MVNRIAYILKENLNDKKGSFWAAFNRIQAFRNKCPNYDVDCYNINFYYNYITRVFNRLNAPPRASKTKVDGIDIINIWIKIPLFLLILQKIGLKTTHQVEIILLRKVAKKIPSYNIISAHSRYAGILARAISSIQHIPFFVTWHGTDIHTAPFINSELFNTTKELLHEASCNFFVSSALKEQAKVITPDFKSEILYNAASNAFYRYSDTERAIFREKYNVKSTKVVTYCGNLVPVKNVLILPEIFKKIQEKISFNCKFWIIGDGPLRLELEKMMCDSTLNFCIWGNQPNTIIPILFNCTDVVVIPSLNEGFSLVCIEALNCGASVVGSNVGVIPEIIGKENCFVIDEFFTDNISSRVAKMLDSPIVQNPKSVFDWNITAQKEAEIYSKYLSC